jgi:hypothetical protein
MEFAVMGYQSNLQPKLFYYKLNLEKRVPENHILRKIRKRIDFDFIYKEVKESYGENGNVSVPPPVLLKIVNVRINLKSSGFQYKHPKKRTQEFKVTVPSLQFHTLIAYPIPILMS